MMKKLTFNKKSAALVLAGVALIGGVAGGTLSWLTDNTEKVENSFTTSNIEVALEETDRTYQMIPGWTIEKDPSASVAVGSEDCYLFVKVEETGVYFTSEGETMPKVYTLDDFLKYSIDEQWYELEDEDGVYYMVIDNDDMKGKKYNILGEGSYEDEDGVSYSWSDNQLLTRPEVTKEMMEDVNSSNQPKLTFTAYAVQLWKSNKPDSTDESAVKAAQFTPAEAWAKVKAD